MIIYTEGLSGTLIVISTEYGDAGRDELKRLFDRLNVKKDVYRDTGSPCLEKLIIPISKEHTMVTHGATRRTHTEVNSTIIAKQAIWRERMAKLTPVRAEMGRVLSTVSEDEPIHRNRRDEFDRRNSHKERIRQNRRNNNKRHIPDGREDSDD